MKIEEKIITILNKIRPFLTNDGGDVEFIKFEDGVVYIRMLGACANCYMQDATISEGIEIALINEIPEVTKVVNIQ